MEIVLLLAVPTLTALVAPLVLQWVSNRINEKKAEKERAVAASDREDDLAAGLRAELREDNKNLRERNEALEAQRREAQDAIEESRDWQEKYLSMQQEKAYLEFELTLVQQELEHIRRQHDEYIAVRERAERGIEDSA